MALVASAGLNFFPFSMPIEQNVSRWHGVFGARRHQQVFPALARIFAFCSDITNKPAPTVGGTSSTTGPSFRLKLK